MEMMIRESVMNFIDVIMRVPPLLIIDELLRISLGFSTKYSETNGTQQYSSIMNISNSLVDTITSTSSGPFLKFFSLGVYQAYLMLAFKVIACCLGCVISLCMFLLWTRHLMIIYLYLISIGVIFLSYWSNVNTIKAIIEYTNSQKNANSVLDDILSLNFEKLMQCGPGLLIFENYLLQCLLATVFCYIHLAPKSPTVQKLLFLSFMAPSILGIHPLPIVILHHTPVFATLLPLGVCKFIIWYYGITVLRTIYIGYQHIRNFISNYGLSALAESEWNRLNVPCVLRTFWIIRAFEQVIQIMGNQYEEETFNYYLMIRTLLVNGCETLTSLLGMTSIISLICHYIGAFFRWILLTADDEDKNMGTVAAILFYILALQTGLTGLDREKRIVRLFRNFCLLFTALLHFIHNTVNPLLMSLSASHNPALHRHLRALAVCTFLILFTTSLLIFLWSHFTISTWLFAVSVFSVEVIVKVLVSLAIYFLFLFDAYRSTFWEQLDDCVYIIRSFGNTIEFTFGVILFFNGLWILIFESGGAIRAIMMCIHAYFNIYCEATAGWNIFMKRRAAVNKINSLPEASAEQLRRLDDVCAICYQEMQSAKITKCNHFFHSVCLRKWLYVQDRCPLCHDILYKVETVRNDTPSPEIRRAAARHVALRNNAGRNPVDGNSPNQAQGSRQLIENR